MIRSDALVNPFPKRRWLTFSVRTLLVAVTIFCVWLGWQVSIVRERNSVLDSLRAKMLFVTTEHDAYEWARYAGAPPNPARTPPTPWIRRMMGDKQIVQIILAEVSNEEEQRVRQAFPEANILAP